MTHPPLYSDPHDTLGSRLDEGSVSSISLCHASACFPHPCSINVGALYRALSFPLSAASPPVHTFGFDGGTNDIRTP